MSPADAWATPLGALGVDRAARDALAREPGVSVTPAPFLGEHSLEVQLPFIQRAMGPVEIVPILVGQAPREQVSRALELVWGGPETAIVVSSDLSHFHNYETAKAKDGETAMAIERLQPEGCVDDRACGRFAIHGLLDQAQRRDLRVTGLDLRNSGDTQGGRDRVVGYGAFAFEYAYAAEIDVGARRLLLDIARRAIRQGVEHPGAPVEIRLEQEVPAVLRAQRATFVTLNIAGNLRGCCGSVLPQRSLLQDTAENALKSAFGDPRFPPLTAEEFAQIDLHVSILSTLRRIRAGNETELARALRPDIDGLVIRDQGRQALFLPSVWDGISEPLAFIRHLKHKAGLPAEHWSPSFEAYHFTTENFGDHP